MSRESSHENTIAAQESSTSKHGNVINEQENGTGDHEPGTRDHENGTGEPNEILEVIREECSPGLSSVNMNTPKVPEMEELESCPCTECSCLEPNEKLKGNMNPEEVEKLLKAKEQELTEAFRQRLEKEINNLKDRADFILQNEQVRASYMLREAHRERKEKISALQTQLECKNLAGLMYVMCSERRKSKLEILRVVREYTDYINVLQEILTEAQELILNLARGFKTATRVDMEWRHKMEKVLTEFQAFIHAYTKGTPESAQFFFDIPGMLKIKAPLVDNPGEDPCEEEEFVLEEEESSITEVTKPWYERLDEDSRPFVVFGDMSEFQPPQRREVLRAIKTPVPVPRKWKEYVFNEMFLKAECTNADVIKDEYPSHLPAPGRWECQAQQDANQSRTSYNSRRTTTASIDARGNMGSILKMITSSYGAPQGKAVILGAKDSMEIASTTRLREKHRHSEHSKVVINVGSRRTSFFDENEQYELEEAEEEQPSPAPIPKTTTDKEEDPEDVSNLGNRLGPALYLPRYALRPVLVASRNRDSQTKDFKTVRNWSESFWSIHVDSLSVLQQGHVPEKDHKIHYEKICPMEKCQRMQVDSFVRSLPPYMRANPFTHFTQTFDQYEVCSPEQLAILKQRIKDKKNKEKAENAKLEECPLLEWAPSVEGVAVQTSDLSMMALPPCTCMKTRPSPVNSNGIVFNVEGLAPVKQALDNIKHEYFYDSEIDFNRFKVIGQDSADKVKNPAQRRNTAQEITYILKEHPSLLDIFQGNAA